MTALRSAPLFKVEDPIFLPRQATPLDAGHDVRLCAAEPLGEEMLKHLDVGSNRPIYYNGTLTTTQGGLFDYSEFQGIVLLPGQARLVSLGFKVALPAGPDEFHNWAMLIVPRSGLGGKCGLVLRNTIGVLDAGYRDTAMAWLHNTNQDHPHLVSHKSRVGQALFVMTNSLYSFSDEELIVEEFPLELIETDRGGGIGSTGVH